MIASLSRGSLLDEVLHGGFNEVTITALPTHSSRSVCERKIVASANQLVDNEKLNVLQL